MPMADDVKSGTCCSKLREGFRAAGRHRCDGAGELVAQTKAHASRRVGKSQLGERVLTKTTTAAAQRGAELRSHNGRGGRAQGGSDEIGR